MAQTNHSDDLDQLLDSCNGSATGVKKGKGSRFPKGLGLGLPDLQSKKEGKQKESHVSETLNKLREQTRETLKGLESIAGGGGGGGFGYDDDAMLEDWVKQFEELTGSQELEPMMESMMQQLLTKQVLHEPIKEIEEKYSKWLQENKSKLNKIEYKRYFHQHQLIKDLIAIYEEEPGNFNKISELMQKMQEFGQPPNDIVEELALDFDISTLGQLSPEMLDSQGNCCIM